MPKEDAEEAAVKVSFSPRAIKRLLGGGGAIGGAGLLTWLGESKVAGELVGEIWMQVKIAGPAFIAFLLVTNWLQWTAWNKDRDEHRHRTTQFVGTLNRYATTLNRYAKLIEGAVRGRRGGR